MSLDSPLCRVVLHEPLIPDNTGNIGRTCVGTNSELHLIRPLGFEIDEKRVKRAGLDYWPHLDLSIHDSVEAWQSHVKNQKRVFFIETFAEKCIYDVEFERGDWLVFGKETTGLPLDKIKMFDAHAIYLPMPGHVRSLNLSNAVAIATFELYRQVQKEQWHSQRPRRSIEP